MNNKVVITLLVLAMVLSAVGCFGTVYGTVLARGHLLTMEDLKNLPVGTEVWVEYNHEKLNLWPDEKMFRENTNDGPVLKNDTGYWPIQPDAIFGSLYRVWTAKPSDLDKRMVFWN